MLPKTGLELCLAFQIDGYKFRGVVPDGLCQLVRLEKEGKAYLGHLYEPSAE